MIITINNVTLKASNEFHKTPTVITKKDIIEIRDIIIIVSSV